MGLGEHKNLMKQIAIAKIVIESEVARRGTPLLRDVTGNIVQGRDLRSLPAVLCTGR